MALIQLAADNTCVIIRTDSEDTKHSSTMTGCPKILLQEMHEVFENFSFLQHSQHQALAQLLWREDVIKVGSAIETDLNMIKTQFSLPSRSYVDLQTVARLVSVPDAIFGHAPIP